MSYRLQKFPDLINMIEKYEYKFKKQMTVEVFIMYISEALKVSRKTSTEYVKEMEQMNYIRIQNHFVKRL